MYYKNFRVCYKILVIGIIIALGNFNATFGQRNSGVDSLKQVIDNATGLEKYVSLVSLVRTLAASDYNTALPFALEAYELSVENSDTSKIVESGRICGQLYNYLNRSNDAIRILARVLPLSEKVKFREEYKKILNNLALAYTSRAEYDKALGLHFKVLVINEEDNDVVNVSTTLFNIGHAYYRMKNFSQALEYFEKVLELQRTQPEISETRSKILVSIGLCHNLLNDYEQAQDVFEEAIEGCGKDCQPEVLLGGQHGLGIAYFELGNYKQARKYFQNCYSKAEELGDKRVMSENRFWLAKIKIVQENFGEAVEDLLKVEASAKTQSDNELLINTYIELSNLYSQKADFENAAKYLKLYVNLKDSIYDDKVLNNLAQAKSDYEQRENLAIIKAKEMTIEQQGRFNMAVMVIAFLTGALGLVFLHNNRSIKKVNVELSKAKDLIYEQNKQLEIRNKELDRLVEKKTDELKFVNLSLKEMNDELNTFIFRTAQDIRGPLATLKGMCYVALMDIRDEVSLNYLNKINNTTDVLQTILKRLLIINRINCSMTNPTEIDLKSLVENVIVNQQNKGLPPNLKVRKNITENAVVQCDRELLSIVLENSIENAVKFCNNSWGTEHFIEVDVAAGRNNRVSIRVVHNGIVTSEYNSEDIYEVFLDSMFSEPSENGRQDLYFVKSAAKKIGAKVEMKKTPEGYNELSVVF
jgi:tetratricopeptide (TPR) repeat protein